MRAVYIHIPFCKSICSYCDFCKFLHKEEWARLYLNSLSNEVDKYYEQDMIKTCVAAHRVLANATSSPNSRNTRGGTTHESAVN